MSHGFEPAPAGALGAERNVPTRKLAGMFSCWFGPYREILHLVWPLALGMVNNAAMQFVDRAYLAKASMASLEAIMPATTLAWVFLGFFQAVVGYSGVFVAQYHGARDAAGCVRSVRVGLYAALLASVLLVPLVPLGDALFRLTATTSGLAALEAAYYDIALFGACFLMGQMALTAYFTGCGRTRIVFWVNLAGNLLNIALDPLLIFGLPDVVAVRFPSLAFAPLGIRGAAWATVFSQAVQFAVLAVAAHRRARAAAVPSDPAETRRLFGRLLRFGIPAGGYEILNMASFTIFVFITGRLDDVAFAASNACFTVNYLLFAPMIGFSLGAQTLVGQCLGRRDPDGASRALRRTLVLGLAFGTLATALVWAFNGPILGLFAPAEGAARAQFFTLGRTLLALMSAWLLLDAADTILSGALKGAGDTRFVFWWMLFGSFVIWLPLVFVALWWRGTMPVLWSTMIVYVIIISCGAFCRWKGGRWRDIKLV